MHINTFHKYLGHYGAWKGAFIVFVQLAVSCYYIVVVRKISKNILLRNLKKYK